MKSLRAMVLVLTLAVWSSVVFVQAPAQAATYSHCDTGRIESIANNLPIRSYWSPTAPVITWAQKGYQYNCVIHSWKLSEARYTACGVSGANGWIIIEFNMFEHGYTYMPCVKNVYYGG